MKSIIEIYKNKKKQSVIRATYSGKYAFVGIGSHSLSNLYPVLHYLNVPIKYIITKTHENAELVTKSFKGIHGTTDLKSVLSDAEIKGIFVCAAPSQHFNLAKQIILAGKHLFIEKPPCLNFTELKDLINLQSQTGVHVLVGMQKRYAPAYIKLKALSKKASHYSFTYHTGAYPEGSVLTDLFIHPIDLVAYIFGSAEIASCQKIQHTSSEFTLMIHLRHSSGVVGNIQLSTEYSWTSAEEKMTVNTPSKLLLTQGTSLLQSVKKPTTFAGIPMEKIATFKPETKTLYFQNEFLPQLQHNQLYSSGYFSELKTFVSLCEGKTTANQSTLQHLIPTFQLLENLK